MDAVPAPSVASFARVTLPLAALCTIALGCHVRPLASGPAPHVGDETVITETQIAQLNVHTAWDVVKRRAPQISYTQNAEGQPQRLWRRGRSSLLLDETPLLFVDGARVSDISMLEQIPATGVHLIRILTGLSATTEYGTNAADGVILIETKRGTDSTT